MYITMGEEKTFTCPVCGREHEKLWFIQRKVLELFGHFPVVRINGKKMVIDPTLPTLVDKLPRDAQELDNDEAAKLWHSTNHYFDDFEITQKMMKLRNDRFI